MSMLSQTLEDKAIFTVYQLNNAARNLLEEAFQLIWVKGELSNVATPRSGHIYFTLKDEQAQIRCAMFKGSNQRLNFTPKDGMAVLVRAVVSVYEARGDYQLIVSHMEEWGLGQLQQAFEALKAKLQAEGLFAPEHKKDLPLYPRHIGVITSHTGAALQDILSVIKRRYALAPVTVYHTQVQGKGAANEIVKAIQFANLEQKNDVIIVARGGGSLEDLWPFNEEIVARAIYASDIPIVTGIGHEVDFTIADFVADYRAPTPSAAAETVTPDSIEVMQLFQQQHHRLVQSMQRRLQHAALKVDSLEKQLISPTQRLQKIAQHCEHLFQRLKLAMQKIMQLRLQKFTHLAASLQMVSPLATLNRGYAITMKAQSKEVITDVKQLQVGDVVSTQVAKGAFTSTVTAIDEEASMMVN
ncbi:MAG: exodeoxyribonuclease VII large subunit [Candidatus Berkiellales bacterium]